MWGSTANSGAATALRVLEATNASLDRVVSQAATGKIVASAADDSAAYVIAIRLSSDAQALMAVRDRLAGAEVPTRVAGAAIEGITDVLMKLKEATFEAQGDGEAATASGTRIQALLSQGSELSIRCRRERSQSRGRRRSQRRQADANSGAEQP